MRRILLSSVLSLALVFPAGGFGQETRSFTVLGRLQEPVTIVELSPVHGSSTADTTEPGADRGTGRLLLGGAGGAAVGFFGGALLGARIGDQMLEDDLGGLTGALIGAAIGESLLLPAGVHLANDRRGSYGRSALVSCGVTAGVLASIYLVAKRDGGDQSLAFIALGAIPVIQLATSIAIERRTARPKGADAGQAVAP